jgi:ElaA protein
MIATSKPCTSWAGARIVWREDCLAAYCRLLPPGAKDGDWAIGRVVTSRAARGEGLARELMNQAIAFVQRREAPRIRLAAQAHLTKFYAGFGFRAIGAPYDEDGIAHIDMLLEPRIDP